MKELWDLKLEDTRSFRVHVRAGTLARDENLGLRVKRSAVWGVEYGWLGIGGHGVGCRGSSLRFGGSLFEL